MTIESKYKSEYSNLPPLRQANLSAVLLNPEDKRTGKGKFLAVQRLNDLSVTMQIARMNLSYSINEENAWKQYVFALNALLWYNACDDYICQYVYLSEHEHEITNANYFDTIEKLRGHKLVQLRKNHVDLDWLHGNLEPLRDCANIIKHRMPILDRSKQKFSVGFFDTIPNPNSKFWFSIVDDSLLSSGVTKQNSYSIEQLLNLLITSDKIICDYAEKHLYSQLEQ